MVTWTVSGPGASGTITLRETSGGRLEVAGMGATEVARHVNEALNFVRHRLRDALSGATGTSGWSLHVSLPEAGALYGDAPGGGGGPSNERAQCVFRIRGTEGMVAAQAIENSLRIARECWAR